MRFGVWHDVARMSPVPSTEVRAATSADVELVSALIHELAEYEKLAHACRATPAALAEHLFGARRSAECLIGSLDGEALGFALFFTSFSTFECKPGIWLEDLFVRPRARGRGLGKALFVELARIAVARDAGRLDWVVLDWNEPARRFYAALGARPMDEWTQQRLEAEALARLARG